MIELDTAYMRAVLDGVNTRIENATTALDWAHGQQDLEALDLIPPWPTDAQARAEAETDWARYKKQVQSLGPRILRTKRMGAVGHVNWGGKDEKGIDAKLETLNLRDLARTAFDPLVTNGITAAWAYRDEVTGRNRAQVLGGYLEPIYREDDPAGEIVGLFQATQDPHEIKVRYRVRVYDFEARTITEWVNLTGATMIHGPPANEWKNTSVPRVAVYDLNHDGYPVGELSQAIAVLRAEVAAQLKLLRVAEAQAYGILALAGDWDLGTEMGPTSVLKANEPGSTASRIEPASLDPLFVLHDRTMERLRADLSLPIASIGGGAWPSGEALQQANIAYISSSADYAEILSRLLTETAADYAALEGIREAPPVTVSISREQMRATISTQVREDYDKGVISLRMAVTALAPYYPDTSSDDLEAFIVREDTPLSAAPPLPTAVPPEDDAE